LDLVAALDVDAILEIPLGDPADAELQIADRLGDPAIKEPQQPRHQQDRQDAGADDQHDALARLAARRFDAADQILADGADEIADMASTVVDGNAHRMT